MFHHLSSSRQRIWSLLPLLLVALIHQVSSFGLLSSLTRTQFTTEPLNRKNRLQDELRLVTDLFVDSFWTGKVGGGARELTESQSRTLQSQQYSEFRRRYSRSSSVMPSDMIVCKDTRVYGKDIIGCAGVEVDTVSVFADGHQPKPGIFGMLSANLGIGNGGIPAKPDGRWDTKMRYAPLMSNLVVSRSYRRKGIAEKLVERVEELCVDWGYDECFLYVEKRNTPAVKLYQKLGYKTLWQDDNAKTLIPTRKGGLESSGTTLLCMKKELAGKKKGGGKFLSFLPF